MGENIMRHRLQFGIGTVQNVSWAEMVNRWKSIEDFGFDSVWVADQFCICSQPSASWFDGWTVLAGLATQTSHIRIGTCVTAIPWHHPAFLVRKALTLDHLSQGRLTLGIGTGLPGDCAHKMTGIEDWSAKERVERFGEYAEVVDLLMHNETTTYNGRYYQLENVIMNPKPVQTPHPPIMIAAMGPKMLRHAARFADTWNTAGSWTGTLEHRLKNIHQQNSLIDKYCAEFERDPEEIRHSCLLHEPEMYSRGFQLPSYDSVDSFLETARKYLDLGIDELLLHYPLVEKQIPVFESIAREAIPELRKDYQ